MKQEELEKCIIEICKGNLKERYKLHNYFYYSKSDIVSQHKQTAFQYVASQADKGNPYAIAYLGILYGFGWGTDANDKQRFALYQKSAALKNSWGQTLLAGDLWTGLKDVVEKNIKEAINLYKLAVAQNDSYAQYKLANCYFSGEGVSKNIKEALRLMDLSMKQDDENALCNMAWRYLYKKEVKKDIPQGIALYKRAANQGCVYAKWTLGVMYHDSDFPEVRNFEEARRWFRLAAADGHVGALHAVYHSGSSEFISADLSPFKYYMPKNLDIRYRWDAVDKSVTLSGSSAMPTLKTTTTSYMMIVEYTGTVNIGSPVIASKTIPSYYEQEYVIARKNILDQVFSIDPTALFNRADAIACKKSYPIYAREMADLLREADAKLTERLAAATKAVTTSSAALPQPGTVTLTTEQLAQLLRMAQLGELRNSNSQNESQSQQPSQPTTSSSTSSSSLFFSQQSESEKREKNQSSDDEDAMRNYLRHQK